MPDAVTGQHADVKRRGHSKILKMKKMLEVFKAAAADSVQK